MPRHTEEGNVRGAVTTLSNNTTGPLSLSKRYWGLDWNEHLPWSFEDIRVESASFDAAFPFIQEHYPRIFGMHAGDARFLANPMTEAKRRFCAESDTFLFRTDAQEVGVFMANPIDWSSYYMRTVGVLPEFRDRKVFARFLEQLYGPLRKAGVERVETECSPGNAPVMRTLVAQGFMVTSTATSERWGATVRFTKLLTAEAESVFLRQFNGVTARNKFALTPTLERSTL